MLGLVFFAGFKILEFCRFRAFGISKNLSTFAALPILRMCFRRAVCLCCINWLDFVIARRGIGIGVYRAAGDCEGHGVADGVGKAFASKNAQRTTICNAFKLHTIVIRGHSAGRISCSLAFHNFKELWDIYIITVPYSRSVNPEIFYLLCKRRACFRTCRKCCSLSNSYGNIFRLLGKRDRNLVRAVSAADDSAQIKFRQCAHRHERNEHQRHHQQTDNAFFHCVPPKF